MSARMREWLDDLGASAPSAAPGSAASSATAAPAASASASGNSNTNSGRGASPGKRHAQRRRRKESPLLEPEDETEDEDDDGEVDETFLALQKLLMNMEGMRLSQVAPVNAQFVSASSSSSLSSAAGRPAAASREEMLESRRREREQFRHLLLSKGARGGASSSRRRRATAPLCSDADDDEDDDEGPAPSVESTISSRMMNGSFSRYSVHAISRERWAKEEAERLPIVLLPKDGKISSPADNPKLNVMHTAEYIDLSEQLDAHLRRELKDDAHHLTPPRSTWCIQMRDFDALQC